MRLIAFSLAACATTSMCLVALFLYALHVPTRAGPFIEGPSSLASQADPANQRESWPERWAATSLRTVK